MSDCMPDENLTRIGSRIFCPDHYYEGREYCALIRKDTATNVETVVDWGTEYDPFDGSSYVLTSTGFVHFKRVICDGVAEDSSDTPVSASLGHTMDSEDIGMGSRVHPCKPALRPKPHKPKSIPKKDNTNELTIEIPKFSPNFNQGPNDQLKPVAIENARLKYLVYDKTDSSSGGKHPWKKVKSKEENDNKKYWPLDHTASEIGRQEITIPLTDLKDVWNESTVFHFMIEVLYDYGDNGENENPYRYNARRSRILTIDTTNSTHSDNGKENPHDNVQPE